MMNKFSRVAVVGAGAGGLCTAQCWKIRNIFWGLLENFLRRPNLKNLAGPKFLILAGAGSN